ncbi:MAG: hypothetical protein JXA77_16020 [Bacteroidales bacterium]|nr:hypothetical protein [Bacteroidales bacterium]MBN2817492.1 hypothetical protein [Bacteroidales bacterium]
MNAQAQKAARNKLFFETGYGHYESIFLGCGLQLDQKQSINLRAGNSIAIQDKQQFSAAVTYNRILFSFKENKCNILLNPKIIYWTLEDPYFKFYSLAFEPAIESRLLLSDFLTFFAGSGPLINFQLKSVRKTNDAIGWPNKAGLNFNFGFRMNLSKL